MAHEVLPGLRHEAEHADLVVRSGNLAHGDHRVRGPAQKGDASAEPQPLVAAPDSVFSRPDSAKEVREKDAGACEQERQVCRLGKECCSREQAGEELSRYRAALAASHLLLNDVELFEAERDHPGGSDVVVDEREDVLRHDGDQRRDAEPQERSVRANSPDKPVAGKNQEPKQDASEKAYPVEAVDLALAHGFAEVPPRACSQVVDGGLEGFVVPRADTLIGLLLEVEFAQYLWQVGGDAVLQMRDELGVVCRESILWRVEGLKQAERPVVVVILADRRPAPVGVLAHRVDVRHFVEMTEERMTRGDEADSSGRKEHEQGDDQRHDAGVRLADVLGSLVPRRQALTLEDRLSILGQWCLAPSNFADGSVLLRRINSKEAFVGEAVKQMRGSCSYGCGLRCRNMR